MKKLLFLGVVIASFVVSIIGATIQTEPAAPFGLTMGMKRADLAIASEAKSSSFSFKLLSVPRPHEDFPSYEAVVTPNAGLCAIVAVGKNGPVNSFGFEIKNVFDRLKTQFQAVYGKARVLDELSAGSSWKEPQYWTMGLFKKERFYSAEWSIRAGSQMKPTLSKIFLTGIATSSSTGGVMAMYTFDNYEKCQEEQSSIQKSTL